MVWYGTRNRKAPGAVLSLDFINNKWLKCVHTCDCCDPTGVPISWRRRSIGSGICGEQTQRLGIDILLLSVAPKVILLSWVDVLIVILMGRLLA